MIGEAIAVLRRTASGFLEANLMDSAAALTYYSVLAIFPALAAVVALLGLVGGAGTAETLVEIVDDLGPASAAETLEGPIDRLVDDKRGAGAALVVGLVAALFTASGYVGAFGRAASRIHAPGDQLPVWRSRPRQMGVALLMVLMLAAFLVGFTLTGPLAEAVGEAVGLSGGPVSVWDVAKWPPLLGLAVAMFSLLYRTTPGVARGAAPVLPGSLVAVLLWSLASLAFGLYTSTLGSYGATYGTLAGVVVFLIWLWLTNVAVLFGSRLNAELGAGRGGGA